MDFKVYSERWQLARLERDDFIRAGLWAVIIGFIFVLFNFQGNTTDVSRFGRSALMWMIGYWNDAEAFGGSDYSHGWLIPIGAIFVIWYRRNELRATPRNVSGTGLAFVIFGLFLHWIGAKSQQTRVSLSGLVLLTWALPFYFCGWKVARQLIFPCAFLIFCIPLNFLEEQTFSLKMIASASSATLLNGLGCHVDRIGTMIKSIGSDTISMEVADPCSGIRSLLAMTALTSFYAYFTQKTLLKKWLLFVSAIPLAIVGNIARITSVGLVSQAFGKELATHIYHDYSGYIVFAVVIGLMIVLGNAMNRDLKGIIERWRLALTSPTSSSSA